MKAVLQSLNYRQWSTVSEDKLYEIFNNDRELLLKISHLNRNSTLKYACSELRNDKEFVLKVIQQNPDAFRYASDELKNDREFVKECAKINGGCLIHTSKYFHDFLDDREIVELALKSYPDVIKFISQRLRNDIEFISNSIGKRGFHELTQEFSNDREIVLESIKLRFSNFRLASDELKNDREFILQALKHSAMVWITLDPQYRNDEEIIIHASQCLSQLIFKPPIFYDQLSDRLKKDRELFKKCGGFFSSFPRKYQIDREIVMECLKTNPNDVITYAFPLIARERVLAMRIVKRNGLLLGEMPFKYRNDREIVSFAIQQNKEAFKFVSEELKTDLKILQ